MEFKVGDYITGINMDYGITNREAFMVVVDVDPFKVKIAGCMRREIRGTAWGAIDERDFRLITRTEFIEMHEGVEIFWDADVLNEYPNFDTKRGEEGYKEMLTMSNVMEEAEKEKEEFILSEEERNKLHVEIEDLLDEYNHPNTWNGIDKILDEWAKNKGGLIRMMENHPNYNGKYQIVFRHDFDRKVDTYKTRDFISKYMTKYSCTLEEVKYEGKSFSEWRKMGRSDDRNIWENATKIVDKMENDNPNGYRCGDCLYPEDVGNVLRVFDYMYEWKQKTITKEQADYVNNLLPDMRLNGGMKASRAVNKLCGMVGLDKTEGYNHDFAEYADAINPLTIKRITVISAHPVDYYTMSFGNSWSSCHTIDKRNERGMENGYQGMYCGGTESYMLDGTSLVFYIIDEKYKGDEYELEPKISRNMFHVGKDKIVQGRVYPQGNDGDSDIYKEYREIEQKVIADCFGVPNLWKNKKGTSECSSVVYSDGVHYQDYEYFSNCNVSYLNVEGTSENNKEIVIGHYPICPNCGHTHDNEEDINCEDCSESGYRCYECGEVYDEDELHLCDDGEYRCEECCFWCEYHEEWESIEDRGQNYVDGYGHVCDCALDTEDFGFCDWCDEYYYIDEETVLTEDGNYYCCEGCAKRAGYVECNDGEWREEDNCCECDYCGSIFGYDDGERIDTEDDSTFCCEDCARKAGYVENDDGEWVPEEELDENENNEEVI